MTEIGETTPQPPPAQDRCMMCGKPEHEEGYANKMCSDCRTKQSQLSVPLWVKVFAAGILLLILIDIPRFHKFFVAGVHYARGVKDQDSNKYYTAGEQFTEIAGIFPDFTENNLRLIVCCERNLDYDGFNDAISRAEGEQSEEHELIDDANNSINIIDELKPVKELDTLLVQIKKAPLNVYTDSIKAYSLRTKDDLARYILADQYYDMEQYKSTDSLMSLVLFGEGNNLAALSLKAVVKRQLGEYDSAIYYYNKMLERNIESLAALDGIARVELKRKHDGAAFAYAKLAYSIDSTNTYSLEAMCLVLYFENQKQESRQLLAEMKKYHPGDSAVSARTENIIDGKTIYR